MPQRRPLVRPSLWGSTQFSCARSLSTVPGDRRQPPALRQRLIRLAVRSEFHVSLGRAHTLEVARLVTDWHGQGPLHLPGVRVERRHGLIVFSAGAIHPHG